MKRAFAIIVVVLLALGMVGLFFPVLLQQPQPQPTPVAAPNVTYTTIPVTPTSTPSTSAQ